MTIEWEALYQQALQEQDEDKTGDACERARRTVDDRLTELAAERRCAEKERARLFEALRRLLIHEYKLRPPS